MHEVSDLMLALEHSLIAAKSAKSGVPTAPHHHFDGHRDGSESLTCTGPRCKRPPCSECADYSPDA